MSADSIDEGYVDFLIKKFPYDPPIRVLRWIDDNTAFQGDSYNKNHNADAGNSKVVKEYKDARLVCSDVRGIPGVHLPVIDIDYRSIDSGDGTIVLKKAHFKQKALDTFIDMYGESFGIHDISSHFIKITCDYRVVKSSSGNTHLYLDTYVDHQTYFDGLAALAKSGIVAQAYVDHSAKRGYTAVRTPWINKNLGKVYSHQYSDSLNSK